MAEENNIEQAPNSSCITNPSVEDGITLSVRIELNCRLAEDNATPDDVIAWKTIKAEAQKRWKQ